jgi:MT0933-like antitoxin protein
MGIDEMKDKLTEGLEKLGGKDEDAVDKAHDFVDERTGDKYDTQTDKAADAAQDALGNLSGGDEAQR